MQPKHRAKCTSEVLAQTSFDNTASYPGSEYLLQKSLCIRAVFSSSHGTSSLAQAELKPREVIRLHHDVLTADCYMDCYATCTEGAVPLRPLDSPAAWRAADLRKNTDWLYQLSQEDITELETAIQHAHATGKAIQHITQEEFPLPKLGPKLKAIAREVTSGRGFKLIKGVPVDRWPHADTVLAYWGLGLYWGRAVSNNKQGHLIGHIKDIGHDPKNPNTRLYATSAAQPYHNDAEDIVALLCLKNAKEGGLSSWTSSISVHNDIVRTRPDLAEVLAGPWYFDRKGEIPEGKKPFFEIPVFNYHKGYLSVNYSDNYYFLSQRHDEVPRLTPAHLEAIKLFNELAASDELRMSYMLQPGDIQILSNHTQLHHREGFTDWEEPEKKRHLLRLWLEPEDSRPLPHYYEDLKGGIKVNGAQLYVPLNAED
ncbi:hypothetical protein N2152v2_009278 [Parachlorella kessleri]